MPHSALAPIAIVGGGPCGLTLARLFERAGIDYVVFERDAFATPGLHSQGGSLDLHPGTGLAALEVAGLMHEFEKVARREADVFTVMDAQGSNFFRAGAEVDETKEAKEKVKEIMNNRPEIDRYQLRRLLLDSVSAHRIRWGKALKSVERKEGHEGTAAAGWVLRFADGSEEDGFRLVIGADGAWSKVRPMLMAAKPKYSGKTYIEGRIAHGNPRYAKAKELAGPGSFMAMGMGRVVVVQQMSDRTYRLYAGVEEPEALCRPGGALDFAADVEKARAALLDLFADWAPHLRAFIQDADGPWRAWPLYTFAAEDFASWTRTPGVTLLGDAAHVALPNGEGVNLAMLDALELFKAFTTELKAIKKEKATFDAEADAAAIERAIVTYETKMLKHAVEHVEDGIQMNKTMYLADGAQRMTAFFQQTAEVAGQS